MTIWKAICSLSRSTPSCCEKLKKNKAKQKGTPQVLNWATENQINLFDGSELSAVFSLSGGWERLLLLYLPLLLLVQRPGVAVTTWIIDSHMASGTAGGGGGGWVSSQPQWFGFIASNGRLLLSLCGWVHEVQLKSQTCLILFNAHIFSLAKGMERKVVCQAM